MKEWASRFIVFTIISILSVPQGWGADQAPYYRFWRGFKRIDISYPNFVSGLNKVFVPATTENGAGKGLIAYLPVLPPLGKTDASEKITIFPDEVALVVYRDEQSYKKIGATPAGIAYTQSHWNYFERAKSSSKVPGLYSGAVAFDQAYDLLGGGVDWRSGVSRVAFYPRETNVGDYEYLLSVKRNLDWMQNKTKSRSGIRAMVALVAHDYIIIFQNTRTGVEALKLDDTALFSYELQKQVRGNTTLAPNGGIDVIFK